MDTSILDQDYRELGKSMHGLATRLFPICRSITGQGVRETLELIGQDIALTTHRVATGTRVFDWTVPREWNVIDAYIENSRGEKIVDFRDHNLHLVNYSTPVDAELSLTELKSHLHSIEDQPDVIPYRTSYYSESWGFCLSHNQLISLPEDVYHVVIDSTLTDGFLDYGEVHIEGEIEDEVLFYTHICHPSLANDNLSGIAALTHLAKIMADQKPRYSYRFVFAPGTIGSISWLHQNLDRLSKIKHGLVVALVGDNGDLNYKRNRNPGSMIDKIVGKALEDSGKAFNILEFSPYGYDERQFCSPGINLDVGRLTRSPNGAYPEYHSSGDNLDFIKGDQLGSTLETLLGVIYILENNLRYINTEPFCEPQLGKRGLYDKSGGGKDIQQITFALLWVLNLSDGSHSLLDIALRSGLGFEMVCHASNALLESGLLRLADEQD